MNSRKWLMKDIAFPLALLSAASLIYGQDTLFIRGTVTELSSLVGNVWVILYDGNVQIGKWRTSDDGKYYIGRLKEKTYTLVVRRSARGNNLFIKEVVLPRDKNFDIQLE